MAAGNRLTPDVSNEEIFINSTVRGRVKEREKSTKAPRDYQVSPGLKKREVS